MTRRNGDTTSVSSRKTMVSMPVVRVPNSKGFAPTRPRYVSHNNSTSGIRPLTTIRTFPNRGSFIEYPFGGPPENVPLPGRERDFSVALEVHPQVHPVIKMRD